MQSEYATCWQCLLMNVFRMTVACVPKKSIDHSILRIINFPMYKHKPSGHHYLRNLRHAQILHVRKSAINARAVSIIRYGAWIIKWAKQELRKMDRKTKSYWQLTIDNRQSAIGNRQSEKVVERKRWCRCCLESGLYRQEDLRQLNHALLLHQIKFRARSCPFPPIKLLLTISFKPTIWPPLLPTCLLPHPEHQLVYIFLT